MYLTAKNMKLLVIALDGGDLDIINGMDMPCLQKLLRERATLPISEDLWSRGWSEIATGLHGRETGAFYEKPKLDGTAAFTQSYRKDDYYKAPGCIPLWDRLAEMGQTIGCINIPTTLPAPKVSGFFISGAGSGFSPASRVPREACYPEAIYDLLLEENFIWEQRYRVSGIQTVDYFIDRCISAVAKRTKVFSNLNSKEAIDFGFLVHKESVTITNLFMLEIQSILQKNGSISNALQRRIAEFYRVLDDNVYTSINQIQPEHIMIVSDHAARPYSHSLNLNSFLKDIGLLFVKEIHSRDSLRSRFGKVKKSIRKKKYFNSRDTSGSNNPFNEPWSSIGDIDYKKSKAFANRYIPGVYLNDERFLDLVNAGDKRPLINEIVDSFNSTPQAQEMGMKALPYRERYSGAFAGAYLPDIWIHLPDTVYPEAKGEFFQPNPYWKRFNSLEFVPKDVMTGMKGRNAICSVETDFIDQINIRSEQDMTVAYQLILNHFRQ